MAWLLGQSVIVRWLVAAGDMLSLLNRLVPPCWAGHFVRATKVTKSASPEQLAIKEAALVGRAAVISVLCGQPFEPATPGESVAVPCEGPLLTDPHGGRRPPTNTGIASTPTAALRAAHQLGRGAGAGKCVAALAATTPVTGSRTIAGVERGRWVSHHWTPREAQPNALMRYGAQQAATTLPGIVQKWVNARHPHTLTWRSRVESRPRLTETKAAYTTRSAPLIASRSGDAILVTFVARTIVTRPGGRNQAVQTTTTCHQPRKPLNPSRTSGRTATHVTSSESRRSSTLQDLQPGTAITPLLSSAATRSDCVTMPTTRRWSSITGA